MKTDGPPLPSSTTGSRTTGDATAGSTAGGTSSTDTATTRGAPTTSIDSHGIVAIDGTGDATVALPARVGRPAIVHAHYAGAPTPAHGPGVRATSFVVSALDAHGLRTATLANSLGPYDGTFPVGFVDRHDDPTTSLRIKTSGPWHLDVASPRLAARLDQPGVRGNGDAVLLYTGRATPARVAIGASPFVVSVFDRSAQRVLLRGTGPFQGVTTLPAGPAFVTVTATGNWSMRLG